MKKHQLKRLAFLMAKSAKGDALTDSENVTLAGLKALAAASETPPDLEKAEDFIKAHNVTMTDAERGELAALDQKGAERTDEENTKHAELVESAAAEDLVIDEAFIKAHGDATFTDAALEAIVTKAVGKALEGQDGDATQKILDAIKGTTTDPDTKGKDEPLTIAKVEAAIKEHLGGGQIDKAELVKEIKAAMPTKAADSVSAKQLNDSLNAFAKSIRQDPKMKHSTGADVDQSFPVEGRKGNLSVADAQLLNICLKGVSDETIEDMGITRPANMNAGIGKDILASAKAAGERQFHSLRRNASMGKALTTGGSGTGAELIPSDLSSTLQARMYLESQVASMMLASEVEMQTNPFTFPLKTTRTPFYVGSEAPGSDPTDGTPGTSELILNAKKLIGVAKYSYEADEDAIIAILPFLTDDLSQGAANAFEGAVINGDTSATHQDSDIHAVTGHHAKLFDGLRSMCLADTANLGVDMSTDGITAANILAMKKKLGRWGLRPRDLIIIAGVNAFNDIIGLEETLTADKVGTNAARILTGDAPQLYGVPIVVSSEVREDLNASGVYDGSVVDKGSILMVHRPTFLVGVKRGFTVETEVDKFRQINSVIASFRRDFVPMEAVSAALPTACIGYNYAA